MTDTLAPATVTAPADQPRAAAPKRSPRQKKLQREDLAGTFEALADLLEAGSPEKSALQDMTDQYAGTNAGRAYGAALQLMGEGKRMREALAEQDQILPRTAREMISSAKTTPDMVKVLRRSAKQLKRQANIKRDAILSLLQPAGLAGMTFLVFGVFALFLGPMLGSNADIMGPGFPIVLAVITFAFWALLAIALAASIIGSGFWLYWIGGGRKNPRLVASIDRASLRIRGYGEVLKLDAAARFCDVAGSALSAGRSEVQSLRAAAAACGNAAVAEHINAHADRLEGRDTANQLEPGEKRERLNFAAVANSPLFPWMLARRLSLTSSQRQKNEVLEKLGDEYREQSLHALQKTTRRLTKTIENIVLGVVMTMSLAIAIPVGLSLGQLGGHIG
jgi:type II secretory pathway component PulF